MSRKILKYIFPPIVCAAVIISVWFSSPMYKRSIVVDVVVVEPKRQTIQNSIICKGTAESRTEKAIYTSNAVKIEDVDVEVGDYVEKGDVLFTASLCEGVVNDAISGLIDSEMADENILSVFNQFFDNKTSSSPDKSTVDIASDTSGIMNIESPIAGVITEVNIQPSNVVSSTSACLTVSDMDDIIIRCNVAEEYIQDIEEGMACVITSDSFRDISYTGVVEKIMPYATYVQSLTGAGSTVVEILVSVDKGDLRQIKPGYSAKVKILNDIRNVALTVPYEAVRQSENNTEYVYAVIDGCARKINIKTGYELDQTVEIIGGLTGNEDLIISSSEELFEGCKVRLVNEA